MRHEVWDRVRRGVGLGEVVPPASGMAGPQPQLSHEVLDRLGADSDAAAELGGLD